MNESVVMPCCDHQAELHYELGYSGCHDVKCSCKFVYVDMLGRVVPSLVDPIKKVIAVKEILNRRRDDVDMSSTALWVEINQAVNRIDYN